MVPADRSTQLGMATVPEMDAGATRAAFTPVRAAPEASRMVAASAATAALFHHWVATRPPYSVNDTR